jgi:hypothetical protein
MRVIRTEMYFDPQIAPDWLQKIIPSPAVSVAWISAEWANDMSLEILTRALEIDVRAVIDLEEINDFLAASVFNFERTTRVSDSMTALAGSGSYSDSLVLYILNQPIVIERSPPLSLPLHTLLTKAPGLAIGTFVGVQAAGDHSLLMLATVPGGIILVSSAIGISKALQGGLAKIVDRAMKQHK